MNRARQRAERSKRPHGHECFGFNSRSTLWENRAPSANEWVFGSTHSLSFELGSVHH